MIEKEQREKENERQEERKKGCKKEVQERSIQLTVDLAWCLKPHQQRQGWQGIKKRERKTKERKRK